MSMGMAHIGPMVISAKKNAPPSDRAASTGSVMNRIGAEHTKDPSRPATTRSRRARSSEPVRRRMASDSQPPSASPSTPPPNTRAANRAESFRFSL